MSNTWRRSLPTAFGHRHDNGVSIGTRVPQAAQRND